MRVGVEGMARIERLRSAIEAARNNANKPLSVRLKDAATQQINKIRSEISSLTSKAHQVVVNVKTNGAEKLKGIKNTIGEGVGGAAMAAGATMLGTAGIGYGVVNAVQSQMNFEKQMSSVKAILSGSYSGGDLEKVMTQLTAKAEEMGATTKFTAAESAQALYYMGMAGWKAEQMTEGLPAVLNLAAAGNVDLATASDIVTDSMTAFGLKAGQAVKFNGKMVDSAKIYTDMMAALVTNANTDIPMLGETLKYAAPLIQAMYAKGSAEQKMAGAEDLMLVSGLMANAGVKASQAGTSARAMFTRLTSQNRNAYFAQNALGIDFADKQTGEARRLKDIVKDFRQVFNDGVEMEKVLDFFEQAAGEKIHADTRRKLNSYLENVQKNGGKMSGTEMMKMVAMLSGQEAMSGWLATFLASDEDFEKISNALDNAEGAAERMAEIQLDNLAGSVTLLGSAWDAFQRSFVKGDAGAGLRSFVDSITDSLSKANELFKDGIDFSDLFALASDGVTKLKNKFLELDGIGSLLAGGALFFGLKKIASMALSVKDTLSGLTKIRTMSDLGNTVRGKTVGGLPAAMGAMNVRAGVVNVSGAVNGGRAAANQARVDAYYARRQQVLSSGTIIPPVGANASAGAATGGRLAALRGAGGAIGGAGAFAAIFGLMDVYATRTNSEYTNNQAATELQAAKAKLQELQIQGAGVEQINSQIAAIRAAEENVRNVAEMNRVNERSANAGATGMLAGTLAGAAIGSAFPVIGTAIGGLIGGILGQYGGVQLAEYLPENRNTPLPMIKKQLSAGAKSSGAAVAEATGIAATIRRINEEAQAYRATPEGMEATRRENEVQRQKLLQATWLKDASDEEIRVRTETNRANAERQTQARAQITKENEQAVTNFGGTLLGQNYLGNAQQSPTASFDEAAKNFNRWSSEMKAQSRGTVTAPVTTPQNLTTLNAGAGFSAYTMNQGKVDLSFFDRFKGANLTQQPLAQTQAAQSVQLPYQNLNQSTVNLSKSFDTLKARFTGAERNFTPATANLQTPQPIQSPVVNLNQDAFNFSAAINSLRERFTGAGTPAQDRNYNFNQPMANLPNYSANVPPMGTPEINITEKLSSEFTSITEMASSAWESLKVSASTAFTEVSNSISTGLESAKISVATFGTELYTSFNTAFETLQTSFSTFGESLTTSFSTVRETFSTFGTELVTSFSTSFESLSVQASATFSTLSATISGGVESARATITTAFQSAAAEVQAIWGAIPGFFGGIFGSLGGIAAAAGSAIAAGINSGIGMIMGAWEALSGWLSSKIASLSAMASSAAASIGIGGNAKGTAYWRGGLTEVNEHGGELIILPSGKEIYPYDTTQNVLQETKIAHNAKGTSFFSGGWSEVNEHGGELMYLPTGTKIIPHATTVRILREQIKEKLNERQLYTAKSTENLGTGLYNPETGLQAVSAVYNASTDNSTVQRNFGSNRTFDNRISRNNQYGGRIETLSEIGGANINGNSNSVFSKVGGRFSQVESSTRNQERNDFSSVNDTRNIALSLGDRQYFRPDINSGTLARYNSNESNIGREKLKNGNSNTAKLGGIDNGTGFLKQQQRQNSALPALEVNAESNNLRRYENRQSITTNRRFENATAFNDIQSGLSIAHNYTGTSYFKGGWSTVNEHGGEIISLPDGRNILPQFTFQNIFKDSLGNIQGLQIPEYNRITAEDSTAVRQAKQTAQYQQLLSQNALNNSLTKSSYFGKTANTFNRSENSVSTLNKSIFKPRTNNSTSNTDIFSKRNNGIIDLPTHTIFAPGNKKAPSLLPPKRSGGILGGAAKIFEVAKSLPMLIHSNGGNNLSTNLDELNMFSSSQMDGLPVPEVKPVTPANNNTSNTSNSTTQSSSNVSFKFGDVNINNGMDFDAFTHKLFTLFYQGVNNSVQI